MNLVIMDGDGEINWDYMFLGAPFFGETEISEMEFQDFKGRRLAPLLVERFDLGGETGLVFSGRRPSIALPSTPPFFNGAVDPRTFRVGARITFSAGLAVSPACTRSTSSSEA